MPPPAGPSVTPQALAQVQNAMAARAENLLSGRQRVAALEARAELADAGKRPRLPIDFRSRHGEDLWIWDVLGRQTEGFFIEVGALDGYQWSVTYALEAMGWSGLLIESLPERFEQCRARRPHSRVVAGGSGVAIAWDELLARESRPIDAMVIRASAVPNTVLKEFSPARFRPRVLLVEDVPGGRDPALGDRMSTEPYVLAGWLGTTRLYVWHDEPDLLERAVDPKARAEEQRQWDLRISDVVGCPDNERIPRVADAGRAQNGVQIMHNGLRIRTGSYYGAPMTRMLEMNSGVHEPQEEWAFQEVLGHVRADAVMLELGAYWGFYSMWFLRGHPTRRAILVEPELANLRMGRENLALNGLTAEFVHAAVGAAPATDEFGRRTVSVDGLIEQHRLERVDILHCDIQGSEADMLAGAKSSLAARKIDHAFISTHSPAVHDVCTRLLRGAGFQIVAAADLHDTYSYDGLIVARRTDLPALEPVPISLRSVHGLRP